MVANIERKQIFGNRKLETANVDHNITAIQLELPFRLFEGKGLVLRARVVLVREVAAMELGVCHYNEVVGRDGGVLHCLGRGEPAAYDLGARLCWSSLSTTSPSVVNERVVEPFAQGVAVKELLCVENEVSVGCDLV
ncbi:hypothetical protein Droror1_Dr00014855 [Drosera rotundifolia]